MIPIITGTFAIEHIDCVLVRDLGLPAFRINSVCTWRVVEAINQVSLQGEVKPIFQFNTDQTSQTKDLPRQRHLLRRSPPLI